MRFLVPRFRLAHLLAAVTVAAVWCAIQGNRARLEHQVAGEIFEAGGKVRCNHVDWSTGEVVSATLYERCMVRLLGRLYIRSVEFECRAVDPRSFDRILQLPQLESLTLDECGLTDRHFRDLDKATGLVKLDVRYNYGLTDHGFQSLSRLRTVRYLTFQHVPIGDETLKRIAQLPNLLQVDVSHTNVTGEGIQALACRSSLTHFTAERSPITDEFLRTLATCSQLEEINISGTELTDRGVAHLRSHPNLRHVSISARRVTHASSGELTDLPRLQSLHINGYPTTFE